jgi:hypothetical protein
MTDIEHLEARLTELEEKSRKLEDTNEITRLQRVYGYYVGFPNGRRTGQVSFRRPHAFSLQASDYRRIKKARINSIKLIIL